mgnify:CR=1 FL=1
MSSTSFGLLLRPVPLLDWMTRLVSKEELTKLLRLTASILFESTLSFPRPPAFPVPRCKNGCFFLGGSCLMTSGSRVGFDCFGFYYFLSLVFSILSRLNFDLTVQASTTSNFFKLLPNFFFSSLYFFRDSPNKGLLARSLSRASRSGCLPLAELGPR